MKQFKAGSVVYWCADSNQKYPQRIIKAEFVGYTKMKAAIKIKSMAGDVIKYVDEKSLRRCTKNK